MKIHTLLAKDSGALIAVFESLLDLSKYQTQHNYDAIAAIHDIDFVPTETDHTLYYIHVNFGYKYVKTQFDQYLVTPVIKEHLFYKSLDAATESVEWKKYMDLACKNTNSSEYGYPDYYINRDEIGYMEFTHIDGSLIKYRGDGFFVAKVQKIKIITSPQI